MFTKAITALLVGAVSGLTVPAALVDVAPSPMAVVADGSAAGQRDKIRWAVDLFEQAGLPLPTVEFVHHDDPSWCHGRHRHASPDRLGSIIDICTDDDSPTSEFLFVHELAHAWDRHALTDDRWQAFLRLRGLDEWQSNESWSDHGAEQAAEMVVWALMDRPIQPVYVHDEKCDELARGYVALTGRSRLHGYRDHCERGN